MIFSFSLLASAFGARVTNVAENVEERVTRVGRVGDVSTKMLKAIGIDRRVKEPLAFVVLRIGIGNWYIRMESCFSRMLSVK